MFFYHNWSVCVEFYFRPNAEQNEILIPQKTNLFEEHLLGNISLRVGTNRSFF